MLSFEITCQIGIKQNVYEIKIFVFYVSFALRWGTNLSPFIAIDVSGRIKL